MNTFREDAKIVYGGVTEVVSPMRPGTKYIDAARAKRIAALLGGSVVIKDGHPIIVLPVE